MAVLVVPTSDRPWQPQQVAGADANKLRLLTVPKEGEVLTVTVESSGGGNIPFRMQGMGEDGDPEDLTKSKSYAAGQPFVYSRDLGQQLRPGPALGSWSVLCACDESAAVIVATVSYHRNN